MQDHNDISEVKQALRRIEAKLDAYSERTTRSEESIKHISGQIKIIVTMALAAIIGGTSYIWTMLTH